MKRNQTESGGINMCKALTDLYEMGEVDGAKKGELKGELKIKFSQICRKIQKNKPLDVIADELEENIDDIKAIYEFALNNGPDYNAERIYELYVQDHL